VARFSLVVARGIWFLEEVFGLAYPGKNIVFRLMIEYSSSLRDLGPWVIIGLFLYEDF
jgi:hypothetical protein